MKRRLSIALLAFVLITGLSLTAVAETDTAPVAVNDALDALAGETNNFGPGTLFAANPTTPDDLGDPAATVASFGTATAVDVAAGGSTTLAGGTLQVNANGSLSLANPSSTGLFVFFYRLSNIDGVSDASVTVNITQLPQAKRDEYDFSFTINQNKSAGSGLFADNGNGADILGVPAAELVSFGSKEAGGDVNSYAAGDSVPFAGGTLTVEADGSWTLFGAPFEPGRQRFSYKLENSSGSSQANVVFNIQAPPVAANDTLDGDLFTTNNFPGGTLFAANPSTPDNLGYPEANIVSFGGGSLGGTVTDHTTADSVPLAGGTLRVRADGSLAINNPTNPGTYTFLYRLQNTLGISDASVTIRLADPPVARGDAYAFMFTDNQSFNAAAGLFADNGNGADDLGTPPALLFSYGGGSLGGGVGDNLAGLPVGLAGGTMVVNSDGSWSLNGAPFDHGVYTFTYRLQNLGGSSDALVTLTVKGPPVAQDDALLMEVGVNFVDPGILFEDNGSGPDDRGTPLGDVVSFGGGTLGGDVTTNAADSAVAFAGGTLKVEEDGTVTVASTTTPGTYSFLYRLKNDVAHSDAMVTVVIAEAPNAQNDAYEFLYDVAQNVPAGAGLFVDNGSGADNLGSPAAVIATYGGGSLGGTLDDHPAGSSVAVAGGVLTVNEDGSWTMSGEPFIPGVYKFTYVLKNSLTQDSADVTLSISASPQAADDDFTVTINETTDLPPGTLFEDNGSLGGSVADNAAGESVPFAGGTLRVRADGSLTLINPDQTGERSFNYRIKNSLGESDAQVTLFLSEKPAVYELLLPVIVPTN